MNTASRIFAFAVIAVSLAACRTSAFDINLPSSEANAIGNRIWKNECAGTIDGLTFWNKSEAFASVGIGHFIWYPKGKEGPFQESFPGLFRFLKEHPEAPAPPAWLATETDPDCPWNTREEFMADFQSERMVSLRKWLASTVRQQTEYIIQRLVASVPKMVEGLPEGADEQVMDQFLRVLNSPYGAYPLIDYVNFKGEGIKESERYKGQGWGLLQVLQEMKGDTEPGPQALREFSESAKKILRRRVQNSDPSKNEAQWLEGWMNRCASYADPESALGR